MPLTTLADAETRLDGFTRKRKDQLLSEWRQSRDLTGSLVSVGISFSTYYRHVAHDPKFAWEVATLKRYLAWSLTRRQFERADVNSTTDAIWLQKILGGEEFNPDRQRAPTVVAIGFFQSHLNPPDTGREYPTPPRDPPLRGQFVDQPVAVERPPRTRRPRPCGCHTYGPHQLTCQLPDVRKGNVRATGRLIHGGDVKGCGLSKEGGDGIRSPSPHAPEIPKDFPAPAIPKDVLAPDIPTASPPSSDAPDV